MSKSKKSSKVNLKDIMNDNKLKPIPETLGNEPASHEAPLDTTSFDFSQEFDDAIHAFNDRNYTLDPDYTSIRARSKVLVRVFLKPLEKDENGIILPNLEQVGIPTNNGVSYVGEMESPFPYTQRAVVVSVPKFIEDINVGDTVLLSRKPTVGRATGRGDNATIQIPQAFLHPLKYKSNYPPINPENPAYGYLSVGSQEIEYVLPADED